MYLPPHLYHIIVRPKFALENTKKIIREEFNFGESNVLDFGCGTGSNSILFNAENYLGVDVDRNRIIFAKEMFQRYKFDVIENNILPVKDNSFDVICVFATIHHIPDSIFQAYITEFERVLRPKGKIIVIEPFLSEKHKFNNWFMTTFDNGEFIRYEEQYKSLFGNDFTITMHKKFKKFFFYNELFFSAEKK